MLCTCITLSSSFVIYFSVYVLQEVFLLFRCVSYHSGSTIYTRSVIPVPILLSHWVFSGSQQTNLLDCAGPENLLIKLLKLLITRLGQLGANISPDRSSLTPQVLIGNF